MNNIINYLKSVLAELKNVFWPSKKITINHTIMVVVISLFVAVLFFGLDTIFLRILGSFIN